MGLYVDIDSHGSENILNNIMQDRKSLPAKKVLRIY